MNYQSVTNASTFEGLPINNGIDGQYFNYNCILKAINAVIQQMIIKHSKVLFIRFDVRYPENYFDTDTSNAKISLLFKKLSNYLRYHKTGFEYLWVREKSREKHAHFHAFILVDGNKVQNYFKLLEIITHMWGLVLNWEPKGLIFFCNKDRYGNPVENGIMIRRPSRMVTGNELIKQNMEFEESIKKVMEWSSYLAKVNQKSNTPNGYRKFNASQINLPKDRPWSGFKLNGEVFDTLQARNYAVPITQFVS